MIDWRQLKQGLGDASMAAASLNQMFLAAEDQQIVDMAAFWSTRVTSRSRTCTPCTTGAWTSCSGTCPMRLRT
jgi:hypothetical protein